MAAASLDATNNQRIQFLSLIKSGIPPEVVAKECTNMCLAANDEGPTAFKNVCIAFAEECLRSIGFDHTIDVENIIAQKGILWPDHMKIYTFNCNAVLMSTVEKFLVKFCEEFVESKQIMEIMQVSQVDEDETCPIGVLVKIIVVAYNVFKDLQSHESNQVRKQFDEPISRLTFNLLLGVNKVRKLYRNELSLLDKLCDQLYKKAVLGIIYPTSYLTLIEGLLNIFEEDFFLFYNYSPDVIIFFYKVLSLDFQALDAHRMAFDGLKKMLAACTSNNTEKDAMDDFPPSRQFIVLADFLISQQMQNLYHTIFKSKKQLNCLACLDFLDTLQNLLVSVDCFGRGFMEGILNLLLRGKPAITCASSKVFMKISLRQTTAFEIIELLISFYMKRKKKDLSIETLVKAVFPHFNDEMCSWDNYMKVIKEAENNSCLNTITIRFTLLVFEQMLVKFQNHRKSINELVSSIPALLKKETQTDHAKNLFLLFYEKLFARKYLKESLKNLICKDLEKFTINEFTRNTPQYSYSYMHTVLSRLVDCSIITKNIDKLDSISCHYMMEFDLIDNQLKILQSENKEPSMETLLKYRDILMKVSLLLRLAIGNSNDFLFIKLYYEKLWLRFSDPSQILTYARQTQTHLDIYACDILILCLRHISHTNISDEYCREWIIAESQKLFDFLLQQLQANAKPSPTRFNWLRTIFVNICGLIYKFGNSNYINGIKWDLKEYYQLIDSACIFTFRYRPSKEKALALSCDHGEQMLVTKNVLHGFQKEILQCFSQLHGPKGIEIHAASLWKICIYFGQNSHNFNEELTMLLRTIAEYHFDDYKRIIAVLVYNLGKKYDAITFKRVLIAHKDFIEKHLVKYDTKCLRLHIVVLVVQIVKLSLRTISIDKGNRLRSLEHLHLLLDDLEFDVENMQDVFDTFSSLQEHKLSTVERKSLKKFLKPFKNYITINS